MKMISRTVVGSGGSSSVTLGSIPTDGTYTDLLIRISGRTSSSGALAFLYINGAEESSGIGINGRGTTVPETFAAFYVYMPNINDAANIFGNLDIYITDYAATDKYKPISMDLIEESDTAVALNSIQSSVYDSNTAISSIGLSALSGNLVEYTTVTLYGLKRNSGAASVAAA